MGVDAMDYLVSPEAAVKMFPRDGRVREFGDPRLANPFESFEQSYPVAPCRSIAITPEILADEARKQRLRDEAVAEARQPWIAVKASLSEDNLRIKFPVKVAPGRIAETRRVVLPRAVKLKRVCEKCKGSLGCANFKTTVCARCRPARSQVIPVPLVACEDGCGRMLRRGRVEGPCAWCRDLRRKQKAREAGVLPNPPCSQGCGRTVRRSNTSGICFVCKGAQRSRALAVPLVACAAGCGRMLRRGRMEGLCGPCDDKRRDYLPRARRYRARRMERAGKRCTECDVPIKWSAKTDLCRKHAAGRRAKNVMLRASSPADHLLNQRWAALTVDAKGALMAHAVEAC